MSGYTKGKWKAEQDLDGWWKVIIAGECITNYHFKSKPNANILAASKDLYEACKEALSYIESVTHYKNIHPYGMIKQALAKADGNTKQGGK